jgi:hypothetical protein
MYQRWPTFLSILYQRARSPCARTMLHFKTFSPCAASAPHVTPDHCCPVASPAPAPSGQSRAAHPALCRLPHHRPGPNNAQPPPSGAEAAAIVPIAGLALRPPLSSLSPARPQCRLAPCRPPRRRPGPDAAYPVPASLLWGRRCGGDFFVFCKLYFEFE